MASALTVLMLTALIPAEPPTVKVQQVVVGDAHVCAVTTDGVVYCWGDNAYGQLGDGTKKHRLTPVAVSGALRATKVVSGGSTSAGQIGYYTCALSTDRRIWCWGNNDLSQLGFAGKDQRAPALVPGATTFSDLRAGAATACALADDRRVFCWGAIGQNLKIRTGGRFQAADRPVDIVPRGVAAMASLAGDRFGEPCAMGENGAIYCWTFDGGSLAVQAVTPVDRGLRGPYALGGLMGRSCGLTTSGELLCWWDQPAGGRVALTLEALAGRVPGGGFGKYHSPAHGLQFQALVQDLDLCALTTSGKVMCATHEAMNAEAMPALAPEAPDLTFVSLQLRGTTRYALTVDDALWVWSGASGQPTRVGPDLTFTTISIANENACGITTEAALYCWGPNLNGEVGDGTTDARTAPVAVKFPSTGR